MTERGARILVVDDEPQNLKLLSALLEPEGYLVHGAASGAEALALVASERPDLILLDVMMPGMNGYDVARTLKSGAHTAGIPIIMVSAHTDRKARLFGLEAGAEDFLTKPVDRGELWLRVRNLLRLKELSDQLRIQSDALEEQVQERTADLQRLALRDALTGLPNRALFFQTLQKTLSLAVDKGWTVAVAFIDIDHLKNVNDTLGHTIVDQLLVQFADRLVQCVRIRDTVGRLGGDEFALILLIKGGQSGATATANKIRAAMLVPFDIEGHHVTVTVSIGITIHPEDSSDPAALIRYADTAMYRAKQGGRDTFRFFTAQMNDEVLARLQLESALRRAIANDEFVLFYQPKVQLTSGRVVGVEALLRWQRPGYGLVAPSEFIPLLEDTGLIVAVGGWVIDEACRQIGSWMRTEIGPVQVAVNVAARQLLSGDLERAVIDGLRNHGIPGEMLEVELTETSLMANTSETITTLQGLKRLGIQISVDDFGTGYSSLAYLRRFPIDKLKIDLSFVRDITTDSDDAAIALTIIRMAHSLRLDVVAEGVESAAQLAFFRRHRCDQIQGYYFSPPLPLDELEELLRGGSCLPPAGESGIPLNTLLIVDADDAATQQVRDLLRPDGYRILSASTPAEGLELLALYPVQVMICDPRNSELHGTDFLPRAKELHPDVLRIILAPPTNAEGFLDAINRGAVYRYHTKPWTDEVLRTEVRDAFRHHWLLHDAGRERHAADLHVIDQRTNDVDDQPPARRLAT